MPLAITVSLAPSWTAPALLVAGMAGAVLLPFVARALTRRRSSSPPPEVAEPAAPSASSDQRRAVRRPGKPVRVCIVEGEAQPYEGFIIDRSAGGICLTVPRHIATGAALEVRATAAPPGSPWAQVVVIHCAKLGAGVWRVGGQFSAPPPPAVLLLFG